MKETHRTGQLAESLCALRLTFTGWRIVARNMRNPAGEIDLIAARGRTLAFIEVKARSGQKEALASIRPAQQQRITRAASLWLAQQPKWAGFAPRFDVMVLGIWPWPRHLAHAFQAAE